MVYHLFLFIHFYFSLSFQLFYASFPFHLFLFTFFFSFILFAPFINFNCPSLSVFSYLSIRICSYLSIYLSISSNLFTPFSIYLSIYLSIRRLSLHHANEDHSVFFFFFILPLFGFLHRFIFKFDTHARRNEKKIQKE